MTGRIPLAPGAFVRCPSRPDWGLGQVQSIVGGRVTANFEDAGKLVVDLGHVALQTVELPESPAPQAPGRDQ